MERRDVIKTVSLAGMAATLPRFAFAEGNKAKLRVGLIGCSGRGIGAVKNMLDAAEGKVVIVAVADLFQDRVDLALDKFAQFDKKHKSCKGNFDIPKERQYVGWDSYKQLIDNADVDIVMNATPPVFRPLHLRAAVEAGKHIFVEKPACVDPVQARELYEIADLADKKGLTIIPGVQRRFHPGYMEAIKRLQDGQIGEVLSVQAYWLNSRFWIQDGQKLRLQNPDPTSMEYQIRNWFIFRWASGDCYVEQHVHNLDVVRWALGKDPIEVNGIGGRRWDYPFPQWGDRYSHFGVDFDFGNGLHCASYSRRENKSKDYVLERFVGSKGILETNENRMQRITDLKGSVIWEASKDQPQALVEEHRVLIDSVLNGKKINMLRDMVDSTLMAIAGRESCYSGNNFKYGWIVKKSKQSLAPKSWNFKVKPDIEIPIPGEYKLS